MRWIWLGIACVSVSVAATNASAGPGTVSYQGVLTDDQGVPITGTVDLEISVYDDATAGNELYHCLLYTSPSPRDPE